MYGVGSCFNFWRLLLCRFRDTYLSLGGGVPAGEVYRRFRGDEPTVDALIEYYTNMRWCLCVTARTASEEKVTSRFKTNCGTDLRDVFRCWKGTVCPYCAESAVKVQLGSVVQFWNCSICRRGTDEKYFLKPRTTQDRISSYFYVLLCFDRAIIDEFESISEFENVNIMVLCCLLGYFSSVFCNQVTYWFWEKGLAGVIFYTDLPIVTDTSIYDNDDAVSLNGLDVDHR